jgi:hypothetical protein
MFKLGIERVQDSYTGLFCDGLRVFDGSAGAGGNYDGADD